MASLSLLHAADWLINLFVIAPAILGFWCGIFELLDQFLNSDVTQVLRNASITTAIGASFYLVYFIYPVVNRLVENIHPVTKQVIVTITLFVGTIPNMAHWKGLWMFTYWFLEDASLKMSLAACAGSIGMKILTGTMASMIFPPFACGVDTSPDILKPKDFFGNEYPGLKAGKPLIKYALGSAISVFFCNSLTITSWASGLCIVDKFGLNDTKTLCIILGISSVLVLVIFLLEIPMARLKRSLLSLPRMSSSQRLYVSTVPSSQAPGIDGNRLESVSSLQNDPAAVEVKINTNGSDRKVSRFRLNLKKFVVILFDLIVFLIVFLVEMFFFYAAWALYEHVFLKERFYGAALSCALGALILNLLQIVCIFGGTGDCSDWFKAADAAEVETQTENKALHLYPNLYTRTLKSLFKPVYV